MSPAWKASHSVSTSTKIGISIVSTYPGLAELPESPALFQ